MKNILEEITLTDVLIIYLIQNMFTKSPYYIIDKDISLNNPFELEEEDEKRDEKSNDNDREIKKVKTFPIRAFDIDNAHSTIRKVDDYLHRANRIKNKTLHLKNAKKEEQQQFLFKEIKHRLGGTYKKAENIVNFLPLITDMFSINDNESTKNEEIQEKEQNENIAQENIENSEEFNQIYELVDMLSK